MLKQRVLKALKRRRNKVDTFRQENGYSWDYVLVFKVYKEEDPVSDLQCRYSMKYILGLLARSGMEIRLFFSIEVRDASLISIVELLRRLVSRLID